MCLCGANAYVDFAGAVSLTILQGASANQMVKESLQGGYFTFDDTTPMILDELREITFRVPLEVGKENATMAEMKQLVLYTSSKGYSVYRAGYLFLTLAVLISLASVISIVAIFSSWWRLGCRVSMNQLEIYEAFQAPALVDAGSNVSFDTSHPVRRI